MIRGRKIGVRARHEADIPVLHSVLYNDVATRSRQDPRPWQPIPPGSTHCPYAVAEPSEKAVSFSAVALDSQELVGAAGLWGIDTHNRSAHLGISVLPDFRGRGLSSDIVRVLCEYGFAVRGLQRLQVETMADNAPMIAAAKNAGYWSSICSMISKFTGFLRSLTSSLCRSVSSRRMVDYCSGSTARKSCWKSAT